MTAPKEDANPHGERLKRVFRLTSRERRSWNRRLDQAQEAIERAEENREKLMMEAWEAGMSQAAIGGILGMHPEGVARVVKRVQESREGGSEGP